MEEQLAQPNGEHRKQHVQPNGEHRTYYVMCSASSAQVLKCSIKCSSALSSVALASMQQRGFPFVVEQLIVGKWLELGLMHDPWPNDVEKLVAVSRPVALAVRSGVIKDALRDLSKHLSAKLTTQAKALVESALVSQHGMLRCTNCLVPDTSQAFSALSANHPHPGDS